MQNAVNAGELLLAVLATTFPCLIFDYLVQALQEWQRRRAGIVDSTGFGPIARAIISIVLNGITGALVAYFYRLVGEEVQDAFVIGAMLWLFVSIPVLLTYRFMEERQRQMLAVHILGWLLKVSIAAGAAALIVSKGA
jgi:hypothetical protein